jgi:hypothetical protein
LSIAYGLRTASGHDDFGAARPIPLVPPVMTTILFVKRRMAVSPEIRLKGYPFRKVSRSALMVAASVVGMPCGKSL